MSATLRHRRQEARANFWLVPAVFVLGDVGLPEIRNGKWELTHEQV